MSSKPYFHLTICNGGLFLQDLVDGVVKTANTCIGWENSWSPLWLELGETGEWGGDAAAWAENIHRKIGRGCKIGVCSTIQTENAP